MDSEIEFFSTVVSDDAEGGVFGAAGAQVVDEGGGGDVEDGSSGGEAAAEVGVFAVEEVPLVEEFD